MLMRYIALILLGSFSTFVGAAIPPQPYPESHHYGDWDKGYQMTLPEKWMIKRNFMGLDIFAAAPDKNTAQGSRANISILTAPLANKATLETFYTDNVKDHDRFLKDFRVLQTGQVAFYGFQGKKIEYYHSSHTGEKIRTLQYFLVHGDTGLIITYAAEVDEFPKHLETFEQSVKTLKFH